MHLILCMAGRYQRFRDAGYTQPKYLLPWQDEPILAHVLRHLQSDWLQHTVLVANQNDVAHQDRIYSIAAPFGVDQNNILFIGDTAGQAITAQIGCRHLHQQHAPASTSFIIHNIDTVVTHRDWRQVAADLDQYDGWIDTFPESGKQFSYVSVDDHGMMTDIREKVVISPHATSGLYGFADMEQYCQMVDRLDQPSGEYYVSDVYRLMHQEGCRFSVGRSGPGQETLIFGTPAEYQQHLTSL